MSDTVDELFEVRTAFYLGNYQHCVTFSQKVQLSNAELKLERDVYMYRAYLGQQKYSVVLSDIGRNSSDALKAVRLLAEYLNASSKSAKSDIVSSLKTQLTSNIDVSSRVAVVPLLMAAQIYYYEEDYESALKLLHSAGDNLDCLSLSVQCYLRMDRLDLAKKEAAKMISQDEDNILTQLTVAWVNVSIGAEKAQDAYYTFQELADKHWMTPLLLTNQAVCQLLLGHQDEAEGLLQQALEKDANNVNALVNLLVLGQLRAKAPDVCARYLAQIKDAQPHCQLLADLARKEAEFDRLAAAYAPAV